jgi:hypothetical protein
VGKALFGYRGYFSLLISEVRIVLKLWIVKEKFFLPKTIAIA